MNEQATAEDFGALGDMLCDGYNIILAAHQRMEELGLAAVNQFALDGLSSTVDRFRKDLLLEACESGFIIYQKAPTE